MQIKIIHIHTDYKFIRSVKNYESEAIQNTVAILCKKEKPIVADFDVFYFKENRIELGNLAHKCKNFDLVVLWGLSDVNQRLTLLLDQHIKIAWRFFGYELYKKIPQHIFSKETQKLLKLNILEKTKKIITKLGQPKFFKSTLTKIFYKTNYQNFERTVKRINYFLCLSYEEYAYLKIFFPYIPSYINTPISYIEKTYNPTMLKQPLVIVGVNRHPFNNHIEILNIIKENDSQKQVTYKLIFSYGTINKYSNFVRKIAKDISNVDIVEIFFEYEAYNHFYATASALVLNAYREMGVGNIFISLRNGVKVYLNPKNIVYTWLKNEGFIIHTIDDFADDIKTGRIGLTLDEINYNYEMCELLAEKYSVDKFQNLIYNKF